MEVMGQRSGFHIYCIEFFEYMEDLHLGLFLGGLAWFVGNNDGKELGYFGHGMVEIYCG